MYRCEILTFQLWDEEYFSRWIFSIISISEYSFSASFESRNLCVPEIIDHRSMCSTFQKADLLDYNGQRTVFEMEVGLISLVQIYFALLCWKRKHLIWIKVVEAWNRRNRLKKIRDKSLLHLTVREKWWVVLFAMKNLDTAVATISNKQYIWIGWHHWASLTSQHVISKRVVWHIW